MHQDPISPTTLPSAQSDRFPHSDKNATRHYRLTTDEWIQAVHTLKPRERDVLYYLRTLDPFGDRSLNLGVREIARTLSTATQEVSPGTISKALKRLDQLGYIDMELVSVNVRIKSKVFPTGNSVVSGKQSIAIGNDRSLQETVDRCRKRSFSVGNDRRLEPAPDMDSGSPHTIHTDQTDQTLSNSPPPTLKIQERDSDLFDQDSEPIPEYRAFLIRKADKLPEPVGIIELWLEKNSRKSALIRAYRKIQNQQVEINSSAPPSTDLVETIEQKRQRFLSTWAIPACRTGIKKAIANNPELKLIVEGDELREVEP